MTLPQLICAIYDVLQPVFKYGPHYSQPYLVCGSWLKIGTPRGILVSPIIGTKVTKIKHLIWRLGYLYAQRRETDEGIRAGVYNRCFGFSSEHCLQQGLKGTQPSNLRSQTSCLKLHCLNTFLKGCFENPNTGMENTATAKFRNLACSINQFLLHLESVKSYSLWCEILVPLPGRFLLLC